MREKASVEPFSTSFSGAGGLTIRFVPSTPRNGLGADDLPIKFGKLAPAATSYRRQPLQGRAGLLGPPMGRRAARHYRFGAQYSPNEHVSGPCG